MFACLFACLPACLFVVHISCRFLLRVCCVAATLACFVREPGETHELREELNSPNRDKKKDAVKKVSERDLQPYFFFWRNSLRAA